MHVFEGNSNCCVCIWATTMLCPKDSISQYPLMSSVSYILPPLSSMFLEMWVRNEGGHWYPIYDLVPLVSYDEHVQQKCVSALTKFFCNKKFLRPRLGTAQIYGYKKKCIEHINRFSLKAYQFLSRGFWSCLPHQTWIPTCQVYRKSNQDSGLLPPQYPYSIAPVDITFHLIQYYSIQHLGKYQNINVILTIATS